MTPLQPHQQRVVAEHTELLGRLNALRQFIGAEKGPFRSLDRDERKRLRRQEEVMTELAEVLAERIAAFPKANPANDDEITLGQACDLSGEGTCEACQ